MVAAVAVGLTVLLCGAVGLAVAASWAFRTTASGPTDGYGNGGAAAPGNNGANLDAESIAAKVDPAVVDVNTVLGYANGRAAGTGIVLTSDGLVLTNNHVVAGATSISVTSIGTGKDYTATVVGYDRSEDVAVIKLAGASKLPTANLANSSAVRTGDGVVAIGNANGAGGTPTVAAGTVRALDRSITAGDESTGASETLTGLIEVDADIVAGDSGGPLVNGSAQVIGIDTAASAGSKSGAGNGTGSGDGYAIPINQALTIAKQIESGQASTVVHIGQTAFLGVQTRPNTSGGSGALVTGVVSGSPAEGAGLSRGDLITSLDGKTVESATSLTSILDGHHPPDRVALGWTDANGQSHTATVTLAAGPVG